MLSAEFNIPVIVQIKRTTKILGPICHFDIFVWADEICIGQSNFNERIGQVALMVETLQGSHRMGTPWRIRRTRGLGSRSCETTGYKRKGSAD
jgi:hypothetical protein